MALVCLLWQLFFSQFINIWTNQVFNMLESALLVTIVSTYKESDSSFALDGLKHRSKNSLQEDESK